MDLNEIFAYIAEDDPIAGKKFIRSLFMAVERLVVFPESGRVVPEFKDVTIREIIHRPCRIVYRIKAGQNRVEIAIPSMGVMKLRLCNADQRF